MYVDSTWKTRGIKVEKMTWNQRGKPDVDSIFKYNQISTWKQRQAMTWIQRGINVIVPAGGVPFYGVNSHGEFIIVLIPPQVMMHLLYISILQLSYAATASRSICHTSGYVSMCVEIQNGMYNLYYTISYSLLVGM